MSKIRVELYVAAIGGAFILILGDLLTNIDAATTLKIGWILESMVLGPTPLGRGGCGIAVVLLVSAFVCWIHQPRDRAASFARGLSVFAVLNVVSPYGIVEEGPTTRVRAAQQAPQPSGVSLLLVASPAYAADHDAKAPRCRPGELQPNATLLTEKYVSSCKPYYSGFLGISSLINNTVEYCESGHVLEGGSRVRKIDSWETGLRSYRYTQIEYVDGDALCTGWVSDGRRSRRYVLPD
jgi:hypothetical protein